MFLENAALISCARSCRLRVATNVHQLVVKVVPNTKSVQAGGNGQIRRRPRRLMRSRRRWTGTNTRARRVQRRLRRWVRSRMRSRALTLHRTVENCRCRARARRAVTNSIPCLSALTGSNFVYEFSIVVVFAFDARRLRSRRQAGSSPSTEVTLASTEQELTRDHGRRRLRLTTEVEQDHGGKVGHGGRAGPRNKNETTEEKVANEKVKQSSQARL